MQVTRYLAANLVFFIHLADMKSQTLISKDFICLFVLACIHFGSNSTKLLRNYLVLPLSPPLVIQSCSLNIMLN